ncbi:MAG: hypothetical protein KGY38_06855 [Desulfobacterales bacterium]|nr:hypothetical protein [Desulfobacterales bacterium]
MMIIFGLFTTERRIEQYAVFRCIYGVLRKRSFLLSGVSQGGPAGKFAYMLLAVAHNASAQTTPPSSPDPTLAQNDHGVKKSTFPETIKLNH